MPSLVKKLISSFNPPDIRKFYKIHREIVHFMVRSAVKVNDGHFDKYVTAPDGHNIRVRIYPPRTIGNSTRLLVFYHRWITALLPSINIPQVWTIATR